MDMDRVSAIHNTEAYLKRIGLPGSVSVDLVGLNRMIQAHLTHVPFEALDVWGKGAVPSLDIEDLYQKIVIDNRGGYCFELNSLFCAMLKKLGFDAYLVIASLLNEEGIAAPPAHCAIICKISGQKYFVDVGFGGPVPFGALLLTEGEAQGFQLSVKDGFYILKKISGDTGTFLLRFRDIPVEPVELIPLNFYISQKPGIHFRENLIVNLRKEDGSVYTLRDNTLQLRRGKEASEFHVEDQQTLREVLKSTFHIDPDKAQLRDEGKELMK